MAHWFYIHALTDLEFLSLHGSTPPFPKRAKVHFSIHMHSLRTYLCTHPTSYTSYYALRGSTSVPFTASFFSLLGHANVAKAASIIIIYLLDSEHSFPYAAKSYRVLGTRPVYNYVIPLFVLKHTNVVDQNSWTLLFR